MHSWKAVFLLFIISVCSSICKAEVQKLTLNEQEYFAARGVNLLVYSNWYDGLFSDSKISGVELIHHGIRTATNGDVRLNDTPEQWDVIPTFIKRHVDRENQSIEAFLHYPEHNFHFSIKTQGQADGLKIQVILPKPLPVELVGKAGFNLEFIPSAYFEKAFLADGKAGQFPLYPSGPKEQDGVRPAALATGQQIVLAPEDDFRRVSVRSVHQKIEMFDGRSKAQNGWFVLRSLLPANKTGVALEWVVSANSVEDWLREPVIAHSQLGYHPKQQKIATVELDANHPAQADVQLVKIDVDGNKSTVASGKGKMWGKYKRYQYLQFDFSHITEPGLYQLSYEQTTTAPFLIGKDVYNTAWHPTLDVYFPVQMDHMLVNEAYRVWHGASHLDDALQAPVNHQHFDLYAQGPTTDTQFQPGQHIPGLNIGGWYDAGDYDIRTQTQYSAVNNLVNVWEHFALKRDTTLVDYPAKYVDLHVPDGKPDLLQQIEHGTLALIAQFRAIGHAIPGIIVPELSQYTHLGDGLTMTDNLIYDPNMAELESDGTRSGKFDDRWAFTSKSSALNYGSIAALTAASRALKGYNDALAKECLQTAVKVWSEEQSREPNLFRHGNTTGGPLPTEQLKAAVELLITTGDAQYRQRIQNLLPEIEKDFLAHAILAVRVLPYMDSHFHSKIRQYTDSYNQWLNDLASQNPFAVLITERGWAGNSTIMHIAVTNYYLHKAFPDVVDKEQVYKGLNYLLGHHPDSDISFVSNVGAKSKKVAYGMNRADFSFISGGIVPGVLILKPDFPENREDWPFFWGQNEYVVNMGANYIFLVNAVNDLLNKEQR